MSHHDDEFFKQFKEMQDRMMPSKKSMFAWGVGALLINTVLFIGAVAIIAFAVKWIIS